MIKWYGHLSSVGKVVIIVMLCVGIAAAVVVAYSLMGHPAPVEEIAN